MKSLIKPKKELENRIKLEEEIPLNTPLSIFIEPSDKCNFKCKFCPTSNLELMKSINGRNYGNMDFDLYKKIIDDLAEFDDNIKLLHLYSDGEPLLNKHFYKMVEYAKKSSKINRIDTTTNAYLLNEELSLKIIEAGIDRINISIEGINEEQYLNIANAKIDFQKLVDKITFLYNNKNKCEISIKIPGNYLISDNKKRFYDIFGNICDFIFIENIVPVWYDFNYDGINVETNKSVIGEEVDYVSVCPSIFYSFAINSNGSVSPCCADWGRKLIIGDAKTESIKDIWNSPLLKKLQIYMLEGNRKNHPVCSSCNSPSCNATDNIDKFALDILKKIK